MYITAWTPPPSSSPPFSTLPRYCPFPPSCLFYVILLLPQTLDILPRLEIFGTWSLDTSLPTNYIYLLFINQLYLLRDLCSTLLGYKYSTTPHIIIFSDSKHLHLTSSHQSQHHLNAHPTASDRSTLDDHHYSIILERDHLQTSRCPALFSLIDPILPP